MAVTALNSLVEFASFPSSPEQIAVFSPTESEAEDVIDQIFSSGDFSKELVQKPIVVESSRIGKRKYSVPTVPVMEAQAPRKRFANETNTISLTPAWVNDISDVSSFSHSMKAFQLNVLNAPLAVMPPYVVQPSSITPSRIKSTTPNLVLLFSLFDVLLEDEEEESAWSSPSTSSPESSQSFHNGDMNGNGAVPQYETNVVYIDTTNTAMNQQQQMNNQYVEANPNISSPPACVPDCDLPNSPQYQQVMPNHQYHQQLQQLQQQQREMLAQQYQEELVPSYQGNGFEQTNGHGGAQRDGYVVPNAVYHCYQQQHQQQQSYVPQQQQQQQYRVKVEGSERAVMLSSFVDHLN